MNETRTGFEERNFSTYPVLHILTHLLRSRNLENKLFCWWRVKEPLALVMKVCWTWMIGLRTWRSRKWALQTPWNENAMNYNYFLYWKLYLWYFFYEWNVIYTYVKETFFSSTNKQRRYGKQKKILLHYYHIISKSTQPQGLFGDSVFFSNIESCFYMTKHNCGGNVENRSQLLKSKHFVWISLLHVYSFGFPTFQIQSFWERQKRDCFSCKKSFKNRILSLLLHPFVSHSLPFWMNFNLKIK